MKESINFGSRQGSGVDGRVRDFRLRFQEFVDAFLAGRRLLRERGNPANRGDRPGEHADVNDEFGDVARRDFTCHHFEAADVNGDDGGGADEQQHQRKKDGIDLNEPQVFLSKNFGLPGKMAVHGFFLDVTFNYADT